MSVVPVAWGLEIGPSGQRIEAVDWHPLGTGQTVVLAVGTVIPAAILGGAAGGIAWRRRRVAAPVIALCVAWFVGIVALPVVATAFDIPLKTGIGCLDACTARIERGDMMSGVSAYGDLIITWPFMLPYLVVSAGLLILAVRLRHPLLWVATGLTAHAALHLMSIASGGGPIYVTLVIGILLWAGWLWLRDHGPRVTRSPLRRWPIAIVAATILSAVSWGFAAASWTPVVPDPPPTSPVGVATLHGFNPPDPSEWFPPIVVPRTPDGSGCFEPMIRPAGRLDLCWDGYRDNRETLPGGDVYHFRLLATLDSSVPTSWVSLAIDVSREERTRISSIWPSGFVDGPCRIVDVEGMNFLTDGESTNDVAEDVVCGRMTASRSGESKRHEVIWACRGCRPHELGQRIAIRELVTTKEGVVPTWTVHAEIGS